MGSRLEKQHMKEYIIIIISSSTHWPKYTDFENVGSLLLLHEENNTSS